MSEFQLTPQSPYQHVTQEEIVIDYQQIRENQTRYAEYFSWRNNSNESDHKVIFGLFLLRQMSVHCLHSRSSDRITELFQVGL